MSDITKGQNSNKLKEVLKNISSILIIYGLLFIVTLRLVSIDNYQKRDSFYTAEQVAQFDQKALTKMRHEFTEPANIAQKYHKNNGIDFKKALLDKALKENDLTSLVKIYEQEPSKINKTYVFACAWNLKYDEINHAKYGKCLNYYAHHFSQHDQKLVSRYLQKIINACQADPTRLTPVNAMILAAKPLL